MKYLLGIYRPKFILTSLTIAALLLSNIFLNDYSLQNGISVILGSSSLAQNSDKICFLIFSLLIQNENAKTTSYYIKNFSYLLVRNRNKQDIVKIWVKHILYNNFLIILNVCLVSICAFIFLNPRSSINPYFAINLIVQGYSRCLIICFIQMSLSLFKSNDKVFGIMICIILIYTFIIQIMFSNLYENELLCDLLTTARSFLCVLSVIVSYYVFKKNFIKEWQII